MECCLRLWRKEDAPDLAAALNNPDILNCLRDGLPYPYLEKDALEFINAMVQHQGKQEAFPFAITVNDRAIGSIAQSGIEERPKLLLKLYYFLKQLICTFVERVRCLKIVFVAEPRVAYKLKLRLCNFHVKACAC